MANHKSAIKRIEQSEKKRVLNKLHAKTTRNAVKKIKSLTDKSEAELLLPRVSSLLDRLAKTNVIHKKKAGNLKSAITKHVNSLS